MDAMQDVFVQCLRKQDTLRHSAPSSLLYRMATNICLNLIRAGKKDAVPVDDEVLHSIAGWDDPEHTITSRNLLDSIFENEGERTRTIAVLHYLDRLTLKETANQVGMSVSGVRKRLRRLRETGLQMREA